MKAAVAASSVLLVLLCGSAARAEAPAKPASTKDLIVGHWYEDMRQNGVRTISIAHNYPDGSYTAQFRQCLPAGPLDADQAGHWRYDKGKILLTTEVVNGQFRYMEQTYQVVTVNSRTFDYRLIAGGAPQKFHDIRVTAESKMPACDLTS